MVWSLSLHTIAQQPLPSQGPPALGRPGLQPTVQPNNQQQQNQPPGQQFQPSGGRYSPPSDEAFSRLNLDSFGSLLPVPDGPGNGQELIPVPQVNGQQPTLIQGNPNQVPGMNLLQSNAGGPRNGSYPEREAATWKFNFYRAPWESVVRNFAQENGLSLMVVAMPTGEFNYFDQRLYTLTEAIDILNDNLIPNGFLLVRNQNKLTLLSRETGIAEGMVPFVSLRDIAMLGRNEMATVAFPLKTASQQNTIPEIQHLLSSLGSARLLSNSNRLIVTDTGAYLLRMRDLLGGYGLAAGEQETVVVHLRNTKAATMAPALNQRSSDQSAVRQASTAEPSMSNGPIVAIAETNSLLISGSAEEIAHYQTLIMELDRPPSQVVIQGLLVEVNLGNNREIGAEFGLQDSVLFDRSVLDNLVTISQTATAPNGVQTTNQQILSQTAAPGFAFNNAPLGNNVAVRPNTIGSQGLSSLGVGRIDNELGFGGLVLSASSQSVSALLRALAARYQTDILSRPQIRTIDNSEALIQIGQQVPVIDGVTVTPVGSANPVIRQDRAGIILKVTPHISPDGLVQIKVDAEKSAFRLAPGSGVPVFADARNGTVIQAPIKDLTTAQTTVSVRAGQTIVLGGMITTDETVVNRKVPFLGDIPLLGRLFRYDKNSSVRKELLIFLTPHIINCDEDSEAFKASEMQRVQINMDKAMSIHGPILEQMEPNLPAIIPTTQSRPIMTPNQVE